MAKKITYFFGADITNLERGWKRIEYKMGKMSANMEKVGRTMSRAFTAPLVGIGALAMRESIQIETAFARVRKTVSGTEAEMKALEKGIMDMSQKMPSSAVAIAEVAQAAGQLGIQRENILSFSQAMVQLGETSNLGAADGAAALAQFANVTRMSQKDFDRLASTIVALGNSLATTERDVVEMGQRIAGAGAQIGMTEAEIMAFAGALASVGIEAQMGGTALSRVMIEMKLATVKGGQDLKNFAAVARMSAEEFKAAFEQNAADAMVRFIQGLASLEGTGTSAIEVLDKMGISEVRVRDALLRSAGASDVLKNSLALARDEWERNSALTEKTAIIYDTTGSKLQIMRNQMVATGKEIGDKLTPHLLKLTEKTRDVVKVFSDLSPEAQDTTVKLAAITAAIGPLLIAISATLNSVRTLGTALLAFATGPAAPLMATAAAVWAIVEAFKALNDMMSKTSEIQKRATGMTPEQVMNRQRYSKMAGEIYRERHGKYPVTAPDFKELDSIVDELLAEARKRMQHQIDMKGYTQRTETPGATPAPGATEEGLTLSPFQGLPEADAAVKKLTAAGKEAATVYSELAQKLASALNISESEAEKRLESAREIGVLTAAEMERLAEKERQQAEALEAARAGVQKFWSEMSWANQQGLMTDENYFDMLSRSFDSLKAKLAADSGGFLDLSKWSNWTEEMKSTFASMQSVASQIASTQMTTLNEQLEEGVLSQKEWNAAVQELLDKYSALPAVVNKVNNAQKNTKKTSDEFGISAKLWANELSQGLAQAIVNAQDLGDALRNIAKSIAGSVLQKLIGKLIGGLFADGAAFQGGRVIPFAKGGIVTKPTIFPMARGMGLMGEAGPEAVVPLKRGSDGKLGIEGGGGTTYITVHINAIEPQSFAQAMRSNKAVVESVVVENIMRNGAVRSAIRGAV